MGVHGLWRLIEPSGKPVPLETLENKILAVDISIWLHQAVKGFQDARGAPLPNAHLLGIYHRLCKLLYFRIKPVFIFDGGVPVLKKQTIAKRNQQSTKIRSNANSIQQKILSTLLRHSAIQKIISEETDTTTPISKNVFSKNTKPDMFHLPSPEPNPGMDTTVDSDSSESSEYSPTKQQWDLHTIDEKSQSFKSLPAEVRHDILTDLKEQRKQSSWGKIHELPKQSGDFSNFQMKRLLKRYSVQVTLDEVTQEMGGHTLSLNELETLLTEQGIVTASKTSTRRIASNENKSYLLIKDVKKAIEEAKSEEQKLQKQTSNEKLYEIEIAEPDSTTGSKDSKESEYERDLKAAIQLSLMETPSTSKDTSGNYDYLENFNDGDFDSDSSGDVHEVQKSDISAAQRYMLEYSDLTPYEIEKIINDNNKNKNSNKKSKTNLAEIKLPKITEENIDSSSKSEEIIIIDSSDNLNDSIKGKNESECVLIKAANNDENFKSKYPSAIQTHPSVGETETKLKIDFDTSSKIDICQNNDTHSDYNQKTNLNKVDSTEVKTELDVNVIETKNTELMSDSEDDFLEVEEVADKTVAVITEYKGTISSDIEPKKLDNVPKSMDESFIEIKESIDINIEPLKPEINEVINESKSEEIMSDSDESDFIEVEEQTSKSVCSKQFEVVINPSSKIEDDIFDDIFNTSNTSNKVQPMIEKIEISVKPSDITQKKESIITDVNKIVNENKTLESPEIKQVTNESVKNKNSVTQEKNKTIQSKPKLTLQELNKLQSELAKEQEELVTERNIKERMASDITGQMYQEAQELLELFGVPYLVAPMEAEAQCAFLNLANLTDGTITDDSDIWLFGGQTVYKNFFNQRKHVMEYRAERIQQYFKLTRQQMILLALLVGSDYTLGIPGIGPVTALEILAAFPPAKNIEINFLSENELIAGLLEFKHWLTDGRSYGPGRTTLRSKLQNIQMSEGFPNLQVVKAYLQPEIESSRDKFSWAKPDFVGLVDYAREKFGWTRLKTEEILKPVVKKLEDTGKQKSIKDYFATKHKVEVDLLAEAKISKRVKTAINRMGKSPEELKAEPEKKVPEKGRKKVNLKNLTKEKNKKSEKRGKTQSKEETCNQDTLNLEKELIETNIFVTQKSEDVIAQEMEKFIEKTVPERGFRRKVNLKNLMKAEPRKGRRSYSKDKTNLSEEDKSEIIRRRQKREQDEIEKIPQREQDKIMSLKAKLKAIEVYRKTKIDKKSGKHNKKGVKLREEAKLSESSDSS